MTLATRCTACGTSFRVVQDQLKVSGGWVRCGRCNEVFNALEGLYEIFTQPGADAPPAEERAAGQTPASAAPQAADATSGGVHEPQRPTAPSEPQPAGAPAATAAATQATTADSAERPGSEVHASPTSAFASSSAHGDTSTEPAPWDEQPAARGFEDIETRLEPRAGDEIGPMPSFMHAAQAAASEDRRRPRGAWRLAVGALGVLLVVQLALATRDMLAASVPGLKPVLNAACELAGCRVEPPRNMAALAVEGSNLRQRPGDGIYELVVALRNRSATEVRLPAFELTLTDSQGQALIRRVLSGAELGAADAQLHPGAELSLQTVLEVSDRRIAGYTVEIFYP